MPAGSGSNGEPPAASPAVPPAPVAGAGPAVRSGADVPDAVVPVVVPVDVPAADGVAGEVLAEGDVQPASTMRRTIRNPSRRMWTPWERLPPVWPRGTEQGRVIAGVDKAQRADEARWCRREPAGRASSADACGMPASYDAFGRAGSPVRRAGGSVHRSRPPRAARAADPAVHVKARSATSPPSLTLTTGYAAINEGTVNPVTVQVRLPVAITSGDHRPDRYERPALHAIGAERPPHRGYLDLLEHRRVTGKGHAEARPRR